MTAQTILPANSVTGGFEVANSLRFDDGSSDSLSLSVSGTSQTTAGTISFWFKRGALSTDQRVWINYVDANNYGAIKLQSDNKMEVVVVDGGSVTGKLVTNRLFRDCSAWYHCCVAINSSDGTAGNRMRLYINGTEETSFATDTNPDSGVTMEFFTDGTNKIGQMNNDQYFDGYIAEFVMIHGSQLTPSSFGEFDEDSGIWKPKNVSGLSFGSKDYYLEFKQAGTSQNSSGMGADTSGEDNHFAVSNLTAVDQATDTCTNNFCTMNPLIPTTNATFSQGNCKLTIGGSSIQGAGIGTFGLTAGKWYFEVKLLADKDNHTHGAISELTAELNANVTAIQNDVGVTSWINGDGGEVVVDGTATTADYGIMAENSIMGIALDIDNYNITYLDDNSALVSNFNMSSTRGTIFPLIKMGINCAAEVNFGGCSAFAVSSANSDADGHGNFEHAPPSGYFAICTKNLAEYG